MIHLKILSFENRSRFILFDVDCTLIDSVVNIIVAMNSALDKIFYHLLSRQKILPTLGLYLLNAFEVLLPNDGQLVSENTF